MTAAYMAIKNAISGAPMFIFALGLLNSYDKTIGG